MKSKHWFEKIKLAHDQCTPLRLSPGEVGSLWKCLRELEVDTSSHADLLASANGSIRKTKFDGSPKN